MGLSEFKKTTLQFSHHKVLSYNKCINKTLFSLVHTRCYMNTVNVTVKDALITSFLKNVLYK